MLQVVSEDKLSQMVARADKGSTGYISECDFLEAFDWLMSQGQDERDYMAIFNMLVRTRGESARRFLGESFVFWGVPGSCVTPAC